jgi:hypothetical protein
VEVGGGVHPVRFVISLIVFSQKSGFWASHALLGARPLLSQQGRLLNRTNMILDRPVDCVL